MQLIFTDQYANLFFLINGLAVIFYLSAKKMNRQRAMKFGNYETLQKVTGGKFIRSSNLMVLLRLGALTALIIGISNPVLLEQVPASESDYVVAIDSSSSMLAGDIDPTRFEAAKEISANFVSRTSEQSKKGVVSFSGTVNKEVELSDSTSNVSRAIQNISIGQQAGTAIGEALITSTSMLIGEENQTKKIILITDGRNNVGTSINESVKFVKNNDVEVNTIGIGNAENANETEDFGMISGENASRASFPNLDQEQLYSISNQTEGQSLTVTDKSQLESAFLQIEQTENRRDISQYFIFLAVGIMLLEWVLGSTRFSIIP
ncbi:MAG: Ca-activated chloride channel family protein [Candidatus Nanohaloarchaea archaeon]|jgi:Ca-activated chloride channel family protein